jgi:16S rRNA (cytidine1402-2'-O)-methyltransferase
VLKLLPTPIGNLKDITYRTIEEIKNAEVIFCEDTRVTKRLLFLLKEKLEIDFGEKNFVSLHSHNETEQIQKYQKELCEKACVYMSDAGTPCISDPGSELVRFCKANNIIFEVLPGANALLPAFCASGFDENRFIFYGFLPSKKLERQSKIKELLSGNRFPVIFYESPHRLIDFAEDLAQIFPSRELFFAKELTKLYEKFFEGIASEVYETLKNEKITGEWVIVVNNSDIKPSTITLDIEELKALTLPKKELAKLISKISGESPKTIYENLL